jgi:hypothetical protein
MGRRSPKYLENVILEPQEATLVARLALRKLSIIEFHISGVAGPLMIPVEAAWASERIEIWAPRAS